MQPIQINVQVNIGLNDGLYSLLAAVINNRQTEAQPAVAEPTKKQPKAKPQAAVDKPADAPKPEAATGKQAAEPQPEVQTDEPTPEPADAPKPETEGAKEYTEVDVRAAMDRTRKRIEGENYKEQTDSEGYKKWHRTLTGWFKTTAAACGAEKPSALPDSESRGKFIVCCDAVRVENDELVEDCPF